MSSSGDGNAVLDADRRSANKDFLDHQTKDLLALDNSHRIRICTQSVQEDIDPIGQSQEDLLMRRFSFQSGQFRSESGFFFPQLRYSTAQLLQLQKAFLIGIQKFVNPLARPSQFFLKSLLAALRGVGVLNLLDSALDLSANYDRVLQYFNDFSPHQLVQIILADRTIAAYAPVGMAVVIRANAPIIIDLSFRRPGRGSV